MSNQPSEVSKLPTPSIASAPSSNHSFGTQTMLGGAAKRYGIAPSNPETYLPNFWQISPQAFSDIFVPLGFVHLFQALDRWGHFLYGENWSGNEVTSRDLKGVVSPSWSHGVEDLNAKPRRASELRVPGPGLPSPYRVITSKGWKCFQTKTEAQAVWDTEGPKLAAMFECEQRERNRFWQAAHSFRKFLYAGHITASVLDPKSGVLLPIPSVYWGADASTAAFDLREPHEPMQRPLPRLKSLPALFQQKPIAQSGYALVSEDELKSLVEIKEPDPVEPEATEVEPPSGQQAKSKGGRPNDFDPDGVIRELVRLANTPDGLPDRPALKEHLITWSTANFGKEPSETTMKTWLRRWVPPGKNVASDSN